MISKNFLTIYRQASKTNVLKKKKKKDVQILAMKTLRTMEWVAISFSRGSSQPRNQTQDSCIAGGSFTE